MPERYIATICCPSQRSRGLLFPSRRSKFFQESRTASARTSERHLSLFVSVNLQILSLTIHCTRGQIRHVLPICSDREERGSLKRTKTINRGSQKPNTHINGSRQFVKLSIRANRGLSEAGGPFIMLNVQRYSGILRQYATNLSDPYPMKAISSETSLLTSPRRRIIWAKRKRKKRDYPTNVNL